MASPTEYVHQIPALLSRMATGYRLDHLSGYTLNLLAAVM